MPARHRLLAVIPLLVFAAFGCREPNPYRCPDGEFCPPAGGPCESSGDCNVATPHCLIDQQICVECLRNADCRVEDPICDPERNECIGCRQHGDCASDLCLEDGTCAAVEDVAYVSDTNASNNPMCTPDMPCQTVGQALNAMPARRYIRVTGTVTTGPATVLEDVTIGIYGTPGRATLTRTMNGAVMEIRKTAEVTLVDLQFIGGPDKEAVELKDAPGPVVSMTRVEVRAPNGNGILITEGDLTMTDSEVEGSRDAGISLVKGSLVMNGSRVLNNGGDGVKAVAGTVEIRRSTIATNRGTAGVFAVGASMVTIDSSVITNNIGMNGGGSITGPLSIKNTVISGNGNQGAAVGGLLLNSTSATFEFNTVADNVSNVSPELGMTCLNSLDISNSIFTGNTVNGCNVTYSLADTPLPGPGTGNKMGSPGFLNTDPTNPFKPMFYRIGPTSAARDSADPAAELDVDIDGQARDDSRKDLGADEFR